MKSLYYFISVFLLLTGCLACNSDDPDDNCTFDLVIMDKKIQSPQWLAAVMDSIEKQQTNRTCMSYKVHLFKYQEKEYIFLFSYSNYLSPLTDFFYTCSGARVTGEFEKELKSAWWYTPSDSRNQALLCTAFYGMCPNPGSGVERGSGEPLEMSCGCEDGWPGEKADYPGELSWLYPIMTGSESYGVWEELYKLPSREERIEALQIPEDILSSLSTEELVILCMFLHTQTTFTMGSTFEDELETCMERYNGFREVYRREDALEAMLTVYRRAYPIPNPDEVIGRIREIEVLEILLGCYQSPTNSQEEYIEILKHLVCGYKNQALCFCGDRIDYLDCGFMFNTFARAKIISRIDENFIVQLPLLGRGSIFRHGFPTEREVSMRLLNEFSCKYILSNP